MVRVAGVEPAWTCAQDMWVAATLHPDLVARHGIEPYPLAFQTSTLPSSSRARSFAAKCAAQDFASGLPFAKLRVTPAKRSTLVDGARVELALHGCRPWVMPLYEPPIWGEMRESNSRDWSHNPGPKPFGQSRHRNLELVE
jgi:hypothetical protein